MRIWHWMKNQIIQEVPQDIKSAGMTAASSSVP